MWSKTTMVVAVGYYIVVDDDEDDGSGDHSADGDDEDDVDVETRRKKTDQRETFWPTFPHPCLLPPCFSQAIHLVRLSLLPSVGPAECTAAGWARVAACLSAFLSSSLSLRKAKYNAYSRAVERWPKQQQQQQQPQIYRPTCDR